MEYKQIPIAPALKGLNAACDVYTQPKGSFPRLSNFLLNKRGALDVCDGSQIVHEYNGQVQSGRGQILASFLFQPTGVSSYYLALAKALDLQLGAPNNLSLSDAGTGGTLTGTYFYVVTALDGVGGETIASNEVSITVGTNHKITLTWNVVPNANSYNVYRGTGSGLEYLLTGTGVPVSQPAPITATVSYTDTGAAVPGTSANITTIYRPLHSARIPITLQYPGLANLANGVSVIIAGVSPPTFNGTFNANNAVSPQFFEVSNSAPTPGSSGTGGTVTIPVAISPPLVDTTQQTVMFQMPLLLGNPVILPVSYSNANIVALFPATVQNVSRGGGGGAGGSGTSSPVGSSGASGTPSGGIVGNLSLLPQFVQFTNRVVMALGNGFPPQYFGDPSTPTNPAPRILISSLSVDAHGIVTVGTGVPHGLTTAQVGANVVISQAGNSAYNYVGPTIAIPDTTHYKVQNIGAIGAGASSGGYSTVTAAPIYSTFIPGFPSWSATTQYNANNIAQPSTPNNHYYTAVQSGVTGTTEPTWPTTTGAELPMARLFGRKRGLPIRPLPHLPAVVMSRSTREACGCSTPILQTLRLGLTAHARCE